MKVIPFKKIKEIAQVEDLFEPVKKAFIDYNSPNLIGIPVNLLHFKNNSDAHIKVAAIEGYEYFSIKVATMFPENKKKNLDPYNGTILLFNANTGVPEVVLNDKGILTDLRTAAAGAIITDFVAAKNANSVSVIGTGIQAYNQIIALSKLREISNLVIYGRNKENAILLQNKLKKILLKTAITIVDSVKEAVKKTTIIITTTSSKISLIKGEWLRKGQHITAIGADDTLKNEIDLNCFRKADTIFVDSIELNKKYGEYSHAIKSDSNLIEKTIEFGTAFKNDGYSNNQNEITLAKLIGLGVQDLAAAATIINKIKQEESFL